MNCKKTRKVKVLFALLMLLMTTVGNVWAQNNPTIQTNAVTNITAITARGNGNLVDVGNWTVTERGICWSTTQNPTITADTCHASGTGTGYFSVEMTDLTPETTYYVRAYVSQDGTTMYGAQVSFTTPAIELPVVATVDVIHIRNNSAVGVARVTNQGNDPTTERGVCWSSTNSTPTISDSHATNGMGEGNYSVDMTGLQPNTTYYMRAYAKNQYESETYVYGDVITFETHVHMQNGTIEVDNEGFDFTDSDADPDGGWYYHYEDYTLVFIPETSNNGVKIEFNSLLINNDFLYFYDGDISDNNLIGVFTCNEYHAYKHGGDSQISVFGLHGNIFTVTSHSYMTVRFVSDYHWRDAGWTAHVSQVPFTPQPPAMAKLACTNDQFELIPTSKGQHSTTLKYSYAINGGQPGEPDTEYTVGTPIIINETYTSIKFKVVTEIMESDDANAEPISSVTKVYTFGNASLVAPPTTPDITLNEGTSSVTISVVRPGDLNDTWKILYTLDGTDPSSSSTAQAITTTTEDPNTYEVTTSGTVPLYDFGTVKAVVQGTTCPDVYSNEASYTYENDGTNTIQLVPPTITFAGNGSTASTTIIPPTTGCTIYYTVNGGATQTYSGPFMVNANDRVEAWVTKAGNYVDSPHIIETYLPGNNNPGSGTGVFGDVVYLDDREPHSWSYYSDKNQPVHSLNPADVKITYFGYGNNTMTTTNTDYNPDNNAFNGNVAASDVAVGPNDPGSQFVYYETLECGTYVLENNYIGNKRYFHLVPDYDGTSHDYPYTTIPNPFSVRPTNGYIFSETREIRITPEQWYAQGELQVEYTNANNQTAYYPSQNNWATVYLNNAVLPPFTITVKTGTTVIFRVRQTADWSQYGQGLTNNDTYVGLLAEYADDNTFIWEGKSYVNNNTTTGNATVQEGGATVPDYRGFYAWRVKRLKGVTIKDAHGTTYGENSIIDAETRLLFHTENEYNNEVDFEALWAKAYVSTSNNGAGLNSNVSYERNFVVGVTQINALNVPATYSSYYPDGAPSNNASSTVTLNGNNGNGNNPGDVRFHLAADTKFENMNFSYTRRIIGNNHSLCFGRGINTVDVPYSLEGIYSTQNNGIGPLDYTIRIESGRFEMVAFMHDTWTYDNQRHLVNGRYLVRGIMGSDYDRAKNDNSKLHISCNTGNAGRLFLCYGLNCQSELNKDIETFNLVVKSGTYQDQYWDNGGDGRYEQSFYVGQNYSSGYPGVRYITVEGGAFGSMNGGRGTSNNTTDYVTMEEVASSIRIKGGTFHGSVFGGAADNMTPGGRRIVITGLQDENEQPTTLIQGWVAGGCNGTGENGGMGCVDGNSYIYVGGNTVVGGDHPITVNTTPGGNVFGAGRGIIGYNYNGTIINQTAFVHISNVVIADDAFITNDVYGGGYHGYATDTTNVYILGGTVGHDVYGGAYEHAHTPAIPATRVHIRGGNVLGSVYGGSNYLGYVGENGADPEDDYASNAVVWMTGGTVGTTGSFENGYVFGGSNGINTKILSNTRVNISGGLVVNNVYGGGNLGQVEGKATVNIHGGEVGDEHSDVNPTKGNVYGGGKGEATNGENTYVNETEVNIVGSYIMGSVFGGGENGHVWTNTVVNVEGGQVGGYPGDISGGGEHEDCMNPYHGSVYGGGSGLNLVDGDMVGLDPEDGWVKGNTTVNIISGAHVMRNVYGGSNVASVGLYENRDSYGYFNPTPNTGLATVNISGGIIGTTGHNDTIRDANTNEIVDVVSNGMVFGSSHGKAVIGRKEYAHVNNTHVIIAAGADIRGSVFGGGDDGFVLGNTLVEIIDGTIGTSLTAEESAVDRYGSGMVVYTGNVYGGGRGIDLENGLISTTAGFVKGNTEVRMTGGLVRHNVYGGGSLANVGYRDYDNLNTIGGTATVRISGGQVGSTGKNNGRVFGSGRGMPAYPKYGESQEPDLVDSRKYADLSFTNETFVTVDGSAKVMGAVFGGGENGHVFTQTHVNIDGQAIIGSDNMYPYTGDVYGGGRGADRYYAEPDSLFSRTAGKVYVQTEVNVNETFNGTIYHAVYGGGTMASVGQIYTDDGNGGYGTPSDPPIFYGPDDLTVSDEETGYQKLRSDITNNGNTVVNIKGGVIGTDGNGNGMVYGSAKGWAGVKYKNLSYTGNTDVNITGGEIRGSVYGGGEDGHVLGSTDVDVSGGTIGLLGAEGTAMGNVFGGGCGIDVDEEQKFSPTAGWVKFHTNTTIRGGQIHRNVYGGGNLASVGISDNHDPDFSGKATVTIKDGIIGSNGNENGHVFGSGFGRPADEGDSNHFSELAFVKNTFVYIQDNAKVRGCVFGSGENGHVRQNTHVFVLNGTIGTDGTLGYEGNVYGGGRGKDKNTVHYSRTSGRTYGNTFVDVQGGKIYGSVYGGGRLASVGSYPAEDNIPADVDYNNGGETGRSTVLIRGGQIGEETTSTHGGNVYGGAKGMVGEEFVHLAYLKNTEVTIRTGANIKGSVFGGGEDGHVYENTKVAVYDGTIGFEGGNQFKGNVYGGGRGIDRDENGNLSETAGVVRGSTRVFIKGGHVFGNVFGGGNESIVSLEKVVNINAGLVEGSVFGGCNEVPTDKVSLHPGTKTVNMRGGHVRGSVYGCSKSSIDGNFEEGHEKDWTAFVNISGGTIDGSVHGLGYAGEVVGSSVVNVGVNAIAEKVDNEWSEVRNADNIYFDDRTYVPTVLSIGLYDVTGNSAEIDGYVSAIGHNPVIENGRGVCWSSSTSNPTIENDSYSYTSVGEDGGRGYYSIVLENLTENTIYYARAYATNDMGTAYGDIITFVTKTGLPEVVTENITVTEASVTAKGKVTGEGLTEYGICWSTTPYPNINGSHAAGTGTSADYSVTLSGLTQGETYYLRAYGTNGNGTNYGKQMYFVYKDGYVAHEVYYDREEHEGKIAIENAVSIGNSVYAGSDYFGTQGINVNDWTHYDATGYTNIFIDGTEYNTAANSGHYMDITGGVFGSGTHCEAGLSGHNVLMREYGHRITGDNGHGAGEFTSGTRTLTTIQRCQNLLLDNVNINLTGLKDINTTYSNSKLYSVIKVDDTLYMANASAIAIGNGQPAYMDSIFCLRSVHLNVDAGRTIYEELKALEVAANTPAQNDERKQHWGNISKGPNQTDNHKWEWIAVNPVGENTAPNARLFYRYSAPSTALTYDQENVILFKDFSQLWVRYHRKVENTMYGELQGFFRMDSDYEPYGTESFAFARPKITGVKNNNIWRDENETTLEYDNDNVADGGFLSYKINSTGLDAGDYPYGYNFFTEKKDLGIWDYPAEGDDGGDDYTKTKQYPYINVYPISNAKADRDFYRMWIIPRRKGKAWYVDGRGANGGWGKDENHQDGWGHYPDKPKLTVSSNAGNDDTKKGIIYDRTPPGNYAVFDPSEDVIYVVGPISAVKEENGDNNPENINRVWVGTDIDYPLQNYKLHLYRYPGGHEMSNGQRDETTTTTLLPNSYTYETYTGVTGNDNTAGPGPNYTTLIDVDATSGHNGNLTLNNVLVDGLYGHTIVEDYVHEIPSHFDQDDVHKPLAVTSAGTTLTLKSVPEPNDPTQEGTELQRGYNNTEAAYYYDPGYYGDADDSPENVNATRHGGAVYVHRSATVNVEGKVTVKENLQHLNQIVYNEQGEEVIITNEQQQEVVKTTPVKIESNVYLPTFAKHTYITNALNEVSKIGITSPIKNAEPNYKQNTMSPIAEATTNTIAYNAWNYENFYDDLQRFFYRGYEDDYKTTYYEQSASNYSPALMDAGSDATIEKTLYFGWTWNNVVIRKPDGFTYDNIDSPEDLAWLISIVNGLNGPTAQNLLNQTISQKEDIDLLQYVWLPVGDQLAGAKTFGGTFDGRGHIITNLSMAYFGMGDGRYNRVNYGLFGVVNGDKIEHTENGNTTVEYVGGVVDRTFVLSGYIEPVSDLNHKGAANIGTLVGMLSTKEDLNPNNMVSNSEGGADIVCAVRDDAFNVGSVIGHMVEGELHSSMGMSDIKAKKTYIDGGYIGGLVGRAQSSVNDRAININNSFSNMKLTLGGSGVSAGGLVGYNEAIIQNCYTRLQNKDVQNNGITNANFKLLAFETKGDIILGHGFQSPVFEQAGFDQGWDDNPLTNCYHYTDPMSADRYRYIYNDNKLQVKDGNSWEDILENDTCLLFVNLNKWVKASNSNSEMNDGNAHKYSLWARPTITGINDDFPVLHLCDWSDGNNSKQGIGDFRSMATWEGGPKLQYAGPVRDGNHLNSMIGRMSTSDYMYVYGDVEETLDADIGTQDAYKPKKLSVYEHAAILHPGTLANHPETYVGVTFDNSCGHAMSTPGINHIEPSQFLPRDWHMFSTPLNNAPLGFDYHGHNDAVDGHTNFGAYPSQYEEGYHSDAGYYNNPWPYLDELVSNKTEFTWLNDGDGYGYIRYWMKGWKNSQSQNSTNAEIDPDTWEDGYFPSSIAGQSEFGDGCIVGAEEDGRYPYGMDMFCWYEPEPHWINFKRNGPNHWHSDETVLETENYHIHKHLPYTEKGSDNETDVVNHNEDFLKIGKGYMFAIAKKTYLQSHGKLNADNASADNIKRPVTIKGKEHRGWNLVGNPYHAYLDFDRLKEANSSIKDFYVIYNADGYKELPEDAYLYYAYKGSQGGAYADRFLHPHQGFFIKSTNGAAVKFNEGMTTTRESVSTIAYREWRPDYPLVNLYLSSEKGCADVTVVEFHRPDWGGAVKQKQLRQGNGLFYAYHDGESYAALFTKEGATRVPLWFEPKDNDIYTIRWDMANGYFTSLYLIDNLTGIQYDMLENDSYVFEGRTQDYASRFYIAFECTDVEEHEEEVDDTFAFFDGSQWVVTGEGMLDLIDLQGRILWQRKISGGQSRVSLPNVAKSMYLLRLVNSKETKIQKIIAE